MSRLFLISPNINITSYSYPLRINNENHNWRRVEEFQKHTDNIPNQQEGTQKLINQRIFDDLILPEALE